MYVQIAVRQWSVLPWPLQLARPICQEFAEAEEKPSHAALCISPACHTGGSLEICICIYPLFLYLCFNFCISPACHTVGSLEFCIFAFILFVQVVFFCVSIGQDPKGLGMGLVNHESEFCPPTDNSTTGPCVLSDLGCRMFSSDSTVILEHMESEEEGLEKVKDGKLWGLLVIQENFTTGLLERLGGGGQERTSNSSNTGPLGQVVFFTFFTSFHPFYYQFLILFLTSFYNPFVLPFFFLPRWKFTWT